MWVQLLFSLWRQQHRHWISKMGWLSHPYLNLHTTKKRSCSLCLYLPAVTLQRILGKWTAKSFVCEGRGGWICIRGWSLPEVGWEFTQIKYHACTASHGKHSHSPHSDFCLSLVWGMCYASLMVLCPVSWTTPWKEFISWLKVIEF